MVTESASIKFDKLVDELLRLVKTTETRNLYNFSCDIGCSDQTLYRYRYGKNHTRNNVIRIAIGFRLRYDAFQIFFNSAGYTLSTRKKLDKKIIPILKATSNFDESIMNQLLDIMNDNGS